MSPFDVLAIAFSAVTLLNLALIPKKGARAAGLALAAALCAVSTYLWERADSSVPQWVLAAAAGVFLATALYESASRKIGPK